MKKILLPLVALSILSASFASEASAAPKSGSHSPVVSAKASSHSANPVAKHVVNANVHHVNLNKGNVAKSSNYHLTHGTKFSGGYSYKGKNHSHWTQRRWDPRYLCECYFDPCCSVWYYWCEPDACYYPVTYCPYRTYCWTIVVVQPVCVAQPECVQQPACTECTPVIVTE